MSSKIEDLETRIRTKARSLSDAVVDDAFGAALSFCSSRAALISIDPKYVSVIISDVGEVTTVTITADVIASALAGEAKAHMGAAAEQDAIEKFVEKVEEMEAAGEAVTVGVDSEGGET